MATLCSSSSNRRASCPADMPGKAAWITLHPTAPVHPVHPTRTLRAVIISAGAILRTRAALRFAGMGWVSAVLICTRLFRGSWASFSESQSSQF